MDCSYCNSSVVDNNHILQVSTTQLLLIYRVVTITIDFILCFISYTTDLYLE